MPASEGMQQRIREIIEETLGVDIEEITMDAHFQQDLGADSLDCVELAMDLEKEFGIEITDEETEACARVRDVMQLLTTKMAARIRRGGN